MFAGIVEAKSTIVAVEPRPSVLGVQIAKPKEFDDIGLGDSIAVNGVCLTVEAFNDQSMTFALGPETLRVTGWSPEGVQWKVVNLERSLKLGDRIHGHLVTGHVDALGKIEARRPKGESLELDIEFPKDLQPFIWPKGSIAVNGVSLTLNVVGPTHFEVGLIPETLKRTNLGNLEVGENVNLEIDNMARGLVHFAQIESGRK